MATSSWHLRLHDRVIDLGTGEVQVLGGGEPDRLSPTERKLLGVLAGRPAEAVERDALFEMVWGKPQPPGSRTLDVTMRRLRAKVEERASKPRYLVTAQGVGYRFVPVDGVAPAMSLPETNLGPEPSSFVGRADALKGIAELLSGDTRLVSLVGPPGMGKTRVAWRYALDRLSDWIPSGVWFCDMTEARTVEDVVAVVAGAIGAPLPGGRRGAVLAARLGEAINRRGRLLLVLDDFEHVAHCAPDTLSQWLQLAPQAAFLVTTRTRLAIAGEVAWNLEPMHLDDAVELLVQRAGRAPPPGDKPVLEAIVRRLDALPLAVELAAMQLGRRSPRALLERLDERFEVVDDAPAPGRSTTLRQAIEWCYGTLAPWERSALAQVAVFRGGFSVDAAEEIVDLELWGDAPWAVDVLQVLVERSLVGTFEPAELVGERRFRVLECIRGFAEERMGSRRHEVRDRHADYVIGAGEALLGQDGYPSDRDREIRLNLEADNLQAAWAHAVKRGDWDLAARAALVLLPLAVTRGPVEGILPVLDRTLAGGPANGRVRARLHAARAEVWRLLGRYDRSREELDAAVQVGVGDAVAVHARLASLELMVEAGAPAGALTAGIDRLQATLKAAELRSGRAPEVRLWRARMRLISGHAALLADAPDAAEHAFREALAVFRHVGSVRYEIRGLVALAGVAHARRQPAEAVPPLDAASARALEVGDHRRAAACAAGAALARLECGDRSDGIEQIIVAAGELGGIGDHRLEGRARAWLMLHGVGKGPEDLGDDPELIGLVAVARGEPVPDGGAPLSAGPVPGLALLRCRRPPPVTVAP